MSSERDILKNIRDKLAHKLSDQQRESNLQAAKIRSS